MRIAIPTEKPGGMEATRSEHFGHCDIFTVVDLGQDQSMEVEIVENVPHGQGGCVEPVNRLAEAGVDAIVVTGLGARPMQRFQEVGITVYYSDCRTAPDVSSVVDKVASGGLPEMRPAQACKGSGNCQH